MILIVGILGSIGIIGTFLFLSSGRVGNSISDIKSNAISHSTLLTSNGMSPNMPGMEHENISTPRRPLKVVLSTFGIGTSIIFISAISMRRRDRILEAEKEVSRTHRRETK
jgi:hypothetical protein